MYNINLWKYFTFIRQLVFHFNIVQQKCIKHDTSIGWLFKTALLLWEIKIREISQGYYIKLSYLLLLLHTNEVKYSLNIIKKKKFERNDSHKNV